MSVLMRALQALRQKYANHQNTEIKPVEGVSIMANEIVTVPEVKVTKQVRPHNFSAVFKRNKVLVDMLLYRRPSRQTNDPTYRKFLET